MKHEPEVTFRAWAELTRGLRDRLMNELRRDQHLLPASLGAAELLGQLAGLINDCEKTGTALERLREDEPLVYEAFIRAIEEESSAPNAPGKA